MKRNPYYDHFVGQDYYEIVGRGKSISDVRENHLSAGKSFSQYAKRLKGNNGDPEEVKDSRTWAAAHLWRARRLRERSES